MNDKMQGISSEGIKKLSLDLLEYSEEFMKIKGKLDNIEQRLRSCFVGEAPNSYNNSLKSFNNNLIYLSKNVKNYAEFCQTVITSYEKQDIESFKR